MTTKQLTCAERIESACCNTMYDLARLYRSYDFTPYHLKRWLVKDRYAAKGEIRTDTDLEETLQRVQSEYGLCFDFVQPEGGNGYWRYQFSWGGPSTELRFYGMPNGQLHQAEFWFLDWFDGASRMLSGAELETARAIFSYMEGCGMLEHTYEEVCGEARYVCRCGGLAYCSCFH